MNNKSVKIAVLIVAAGTGQRFGADMLPKQYMPLFGKPLLRWSLDTFRRHPDISAVQVVIHADHRAFYETAVAGLVLPPPVTGGKTRQESVRLGLAALAAMENAPDFVLIHDAARPCLSAALISAICEKLAAGDEAVIPALPVTDTLRRALQGGLTKTEDRDGLYTVQTPQGFRLALIRDCHERFQGRELTDDAALVEEAGGAVTLLPGEARNIKITYPESLAEAERLLAEQRQDIRTGKGYDVHRLVPPETPGRPLRLGGIDVPHDKVLEGHSDADVALHAITDALLGAICDGDIGTHFSPGDPRWKGADSAMMLRHAAELAAAADGLIAHVDLTVICEAPKIGPHRAAMRRRIAEILALPQARVSVKATTTEGLGFTGRGEGIAAEAAVTLRLPFGAPAADRDASTNIPADARAA